MVKSVPGPGIDSLGSAANLATASSFEYSWEGPGGRAIYKFRLLREADESRLWVVQAHLAFAVVARVAAAETELGNNVA